jgi:hypothetical protein
MGEDAALGAKATWSQARLTVASVLPILLLAGSAESAGLIGARAASRAAVSTIPVSAPNSVVATAVRLEATAQSTKLIFDLSERVEARTFPLANPDRIVVDLPEIAFRVPPLLPQATGRRGHRGNAPAVAGLVTSYRFGQFAPGHSRVILDLSAPARVLHAETQPCHRDSLSSSRPPIARASRPQLPLPTFSASRRRSPSRRRWWLRRRRTSP